MNARIEIIDAKTHKFVRWDPINGKDCEHVENNAMLHFFGLPPSVYTGNIEYIGEQPKFDWKPCGPGRYEVKWGFNNPPECQTVVIGKLADMFQFMARKGWRA